LNGESTTRPFVYRDRGTMATIGRASAVANLRGHEFSGGFAWLLWLFVHLMYLVQFQNRLLVLIQWAWNYFSRNRSARLITYVDGALTKESIESRPYERAEPVAHGHYNLPR
jgi:NADH dehydrogenase